MINRTMDATFLTTVANHPDVRPWLGGADGPLDLQPLADNPLNVLLEAPGAGGWLLQALMPGVYDLHTLFLPTGRGAAYFRHARAALRWMFTQTDALEILTKCPDDNPRARMAASVIGFRERFRREDAWPTGAGISYRVFSVDDWFVRDAEVIKDGRAFHVALEAAKTAAGSTLAPHPEDDAHDRAVGAAVGMILAGRTDKAIGFYNRWALFAGYATIAAVGHNVVDVRDAIVEISSGEMRVLKVRGVAAEL